MCGHPIFAVMQWVRSSNVCCHMICAVIQCVRYKHVYSEMTTISLIYVLVENEVEEVVVEVVLVDVVDVRFMVFSQNRAC